MHAQDDVNHRHILRMLESTFWHGLAHISQCFPFTAPCSTLERTPTPPISVTTPVGEITQPVRVVTPPERVITPPARIVTPPSTTAAVPVFLARSLAISVPTVGGPDASSYEPEQLLLTPSQAAEETKLSEPQTKKERGKNKKTTTVFEELANTNYENKPLLGIVIIRNIETPFLFILLVVAPVLAWAT